MREGMHEPFEFFSLKNIIIAIHVTHSRFFLNLGVNIFKLFPKPVL